VLNYSARGSGQAGMWLAYEDGGLRELGVDADLQNVAATSRIIPAMLAGEVNLSGMDPGASILASLEGVDMALLFAGANRPTLSIIAQPSIDEPAKLSGKTLAITRLGSATHTSAILALDLFGLRADRDVTLLQVGEPGAMVAGLETNQIDAAVLNSPFTTLARRAGYRELINLSTAGPEYPTVVVGALRSWVTANEEAVRRFARAYTRGRQRAREDKAWALEVYRKYLQVEDAEALEDFYQEVSACCAAVPYVTEEGTARLLADLAQSEPRLAGHQPNEWIDSRFLRKLEAERSPR
jgi:ABC-type nitrate/sulfonate/bicarbonate transport system substrate-binding protein